MLNLCVIVQLLCFLIITQHKTLVFNGNLLLKRTCYVCIFETFHMSLHYLFIHSFVTNYEQGNYIIYLLPPTLK